LCKTAYSPSKINFPGMVTDMLNITLPAEMHRALALCQ
jgi:hypothetical protein